MSLGNVYFQAPRCMLTWRFGAASQVNAATGVVTAPLPPDTSAVPSMLGGQGKIDVLCNWATGARPGGGLQKLVLSPRYRLFYGTGSSAPSSNTTAAGDSGRNVVVRFAGNDRRVPAGGIVAPTTGAAAVASVPHKYRPRTVAPVVVVQDRIVATELVADQIELYRAADPGTAYGQAAEFWYDIMGVDGVTLGDAAATDAFSRQIPRERAFYFEVGWITDDGTQGPAVDLEPPFLEGDEFSILLWLGKAANG